MLQIKEIKKQYITGDLVQTALDGVSLTLRDNEFVAILGPSGSGKTTLLNVIGGLDRYDSGDLIINGISTKKYNDRDWDSYRNHTIGFVFQSYNLIPHQSVLANVELALTISGISRSERRRRAKEALQAVGLGDQTHKRPNQMSGGQMQRVAIARALVNNPDILLADEPTGALDTTTSVQIMDLLKEVARDKLVVMVTHNPDLAESYANRIVRVKDGKIVDDSNPYMPAQASLEPPKHKNMGRASMSFRTALSLSFNNLWTKKGRTLLTAFAGSIGIIGIALIMSLSTGFQKYIDKIQEDTLSNYPLTLQQENADAAAMMAAMGAALGGSGEEAPPKTVIEQQMLSQMFSSVGKNDLAAFKAYLTEHYDEVAHTVNAIKYSYNVKPRIYLTDTSLGIQQVNPSTLFGNLTGSFAMSAYMDSDVFYEMMDNVGLLQTQYEVLEGRWPQAYNEMLLVLEDPGKIQDYMAYTLHLRDPSELEGMINTVMSGQEPEPVELEPMQWTYEQLMQIGFTLVPSSARYRYNSEYNVWEDMSKDKAHMQQLIESGETLTIVGIVCAREGSSATALQPGIAYTSDLTRYVIATAQESAIVKGQLEQPEINVFTGKPFGEEAQDGELNFENMISVDGDKLSSAFGVNISTDRLMRIAEDYLADALASIEIDTEPAQKDFIQLLQQLATDMLQSYITENADEEGRARLSLADADTIAQSYMESEAAGDILKPVVKKYDGDQAEYAQICSRMLSGMLSFYVSSHLEDIDSLLPRQSAAPLETETPEQTESEATEPETTEPEVTQPDATLPQEGEDVPEEPESTAPDISVDPEQLAAWITQEDVAAAVSQYCESAMVKGVAAAMGGKMMEGEIYRQVSKKLSGLGNVLMKAVGNSFYVDEEAIASAFQFNMNAEDLRRLMEAMSGANDTASFENNLRGLGYADQDQPTSISAYFVDFAGKEEFLAFLDGYNDKMEASGQEDKIIGYADLTGIMMSSVRIIIDSVSYALIAFVAVSLVVSSIMVGIITYISVMERTKEIGVLRAIGASKRNISQVFNAETFIIGLCSGVLGVGLSLLILIPGNALIHYLTGNPDIVAQLPVTNAVALIALSVLLTLIGGLIPAKKAAKKDPVIALRSE